jgi:hypothetical protein
MRTLLHVLLLGRLQLHTTWFFTSSMGSKRFRQTVGRAYIALLIASLLLGAPCMFVSHHRVELLPFLARFFFRVRGICIHR